MTDDYKDFGENPGIALTTCTGCGMPRGFSEGGGYRCEYCGKPWAEAKPPRIAPDEVRVSRELLRDCHRAVRDFYMLLPATVGTRYEYLHELLKTLQAHPALAAASGDDGGTT